MGCRPGRGLFAQRPGHPVCRADPTPGVGQPDREYPRTMPERQRRPDLDERFSLFPLEGEEALEILLGTERPEDETSEEESEEL